MVETNKPVGRPASKVYDRAGKLVPGLSKNAADGRFYITRSKPRKWLGKDFDAALIRFRAWEAGEKPGHVFVNALSHTLPSYYVNKPGEYLVGIPDEIFWPMVRERITADPHYAAQRTGLPLDRMHQFKTPEDTKGMTLADVYAQYQKRKRTLSAQAKSDNKRYWQFFCDTVGVQHIGKIKPGHITDYNNAVHDEKKSASYVRNSFSAVRSIFKSALKQGQDSDNIRIVLGYLAEQLEWVSKTGRNPQPISKTDFAKWLEASDNKHKAMLLMMLNCAMRQEDLATLPMTLDNGSKVIDLKAKTLVWRRKKTGQVPRVAVLWDTTVDAIKDYQAEQPHKHNRLFVNANALPYASGRVLAHGLRESRTKAGLADGVKIEHIRDGALTTAGNATGVTKEMYSMLAGHTTGQADDYVLRAAQTTKPATDAIYKHYFG